MPVPERAVQLALAQPPAAKSAGAFVINLNSPSGDTSQQSPPHSPHLSPQSPWCSPLPPYSPQQSWPSTPHSMPSPCARAPALQDVGSPQPLQSPQVSMQAPPSPQSSASLSAYHHLQLCNSTCDQSEPVAEGKVQPGPAAVDSPEQQDRLEGCLVTARAPGKAEACSVSLSPSGEESICRWLCRSKLLDFPGRTPLPGCLQ